MKLPSMRRLSLFVSENSIFSFFSYISIIVVFLVFSLLMLQPHKFQVLENREGYSKNDAHMMYKEMLAYVNKESSDGEINLEMLLDGQTGEERVTYRAAPGDTLSGIAKLFGTTVSAINRVNSYGPKKVLRVGEKVIIAYDRSIIYTIIDAVSVESFSKKYKINSEDLLTLNYLDSTESVLDVGQQIFVPLNKIEAEERGLLEKKRFVMLDIANPVFAQDGDGGGVKKKESDGNINAGGKKDKTLSGDGDIIKSLDGSSSVPVEYTQKVVSAEDTARFLQEITQAKKEAEIAKKRAKELEKQAREAEKLVEIEAEKKKERARSLAIKKLEQARLAKIESEKKAEILRKAEEKERKRSEDLAKRKEIERLEKEKKSEMDERRRLAHIAASCTTKQCYHEGRCREKPKNAQCAPHDRDNAWVCSKGYIDTGRSCITKAAYKKKTVKATAPKKKMGVLKQWYLNPYKYGYSSGWGGGHCTHYAGFYWSSKLGKETNWRGNAKHRYANASAAGRKVGQTPRVDSIIVMKYGSQGWNGYGHVGIVIAVDSASRQVLIQDMNYVGRYIVSQHRVNLDSKKNPVIGFIYPY